MHDKILFCNVFNNYLCLATEQQRKKINVIFSSLSNYYCASNKVASPTDNAKMNVQAAMSRRHKHKKQ